MLCSSAIKITVKTPMVSVQTPILTRDHLFWSGLCGFLFQHSVKHLHVTRASWASVACFLDASTIGTIWAGILTCSGNNLMTSYPRYHPIWHPIIPSGAYFSQKYSSWGDHRFDWESGRCSFGTRCTALDLGFGSHRQKMWVTWFFFNDENLRFSQMSSCFIFLIWTQAISDQSRTLSGWSSISFSSIIQQIHTNICPKWWFFLIPRYPNMSDRLEGKPCRNDQSPEIPRSDSHQDIYRNSCLASETKVGTS